MSWPVFAAVFRLTRLTLRLCGTNALECWTCKRRLLPWQKNWPSLAAPAFYFPLKGSAANRRNSNWQVCTRRNWLLVLLFYFFLYSGALCRKATGETIHVTRARNPRRYTLVSLSLNSSLLVLPQILRLSLGSACGRARARRVFLLKSKCALDLNDAIRLLRDLVGDKIMHYHINNCQLVCRFQLGFAG